MRALAEIWTLPNTLLGVLVGLLARGVPRRIPGRSFLGVAGRGVLAALVRRRGITATTFGSVVVFWRPEEAGKKWLLDHEEVHVRQYRLLGPLFVPLYLLFVPFTGYGDRHPLEAPAYRVGDGRRCEMDTQSRSRP